MTLEQFIDQQPFSRFQLQTIVICGALVFMDGFDAQSMGFVAPALSAELHISRVELGRAISSGLFGMMVGALLCGPLADRIGRKPVLVGSALVFGLATLMTATATSLQSLMIFRLITGLGLGGAMPNAIALTSEYSPKRFRATAVMTMFTGFSLGAATGGFVAAGLTTRFGWQSVFIVGGTLPLVTAILCFAALPESIRFLVAAGGHQDKVRKYLARIAPNHAQLPGMSFTDDGHRGSGLRIHELFTHGRARVTPLLWVVFFMSLLDLYFLNSWLPTVMNDNGVKVETAILITSLFQVGGSAGAVLLGRLFDRLASFGLLASVYFGAGVSIVLIGTAGASIALLTVTVFAAGFFVIGGQTGSNALTAEFYPTAIRSTGVGWALGIGRIGSIIGPTLGGALLSMGGDTKHVFFAAAVPALIAALAALGVSMVNMSHTAVPLEGSISR